MRYTRGERLIIMTVDEIPEDHEEDDAPEPATEETVNPYEGHEDEAQDPEA